MLQGISMFFLNYSMLAALMCLFGVAAAMISATAASIYAVLAAGLFSLLLCRDWRAYRIYLNETALIKNERLSAEKEGRLKAAPAVLSAKIQNEDLAAKLRHFQVLAETWEARPRAEDSLNTVRGRHSIEALRTSCQALLDDEVLLGSITAQQHLLSLLGKLSAKLEAQLDQEREVKVSTFAVNCNSLGRQIA